MLELRFKFLGGFEAYGGEIPFQGFDSDKTRLLLGYLVVEAATSHRRDHLIGLFWPEKPEASAHHSLSQALYSLRKSFQSFTPLNPLIITPQTVQYHWDRRSWSDVAEFNRLIQVCERHTHPDKLTCRTCLSHMEKAFTLYRGDFFEGMGLDGCDAYEDWLFEHRELDRQKMSQVARWLAESYAQRNAPEKALHYAVQLAVLDPYGEENQRRIMRLLLAQGLRNEALIRYEHFREALGHELNIEPEDETRLLYERILSPPRATPPGIQPPNNLPVRSWPLIGRQAELKRLCKELNHPACRLITLVGPGGCGKTSLALEVGRCLMSDFPDGVYLVRLDIHSRRDTFWSHLARVVCPELSEHMHLAQQYKAEFHLLLLNFLREKRLLLILDSFENMQGAADDLSELLHHTPWLKILTTSRVVVGLEGEMVFRLEGLACPGETSHSENILDYSAVELFFEAARRTNPEFTLSQQNAPAVSSICNLLQGNPLGLVLASAWARMLEPHQILCEMRRSLDFLVSGWADLPARQVSLRATFEYSWQLLNPEDQVSFARLSIFRGAFSSQRTLQITGLTLLKLKSFLDQSLLQYSDLSRFRLHDALKQFAREKLVQMPDEYEALHQQYSRIYLSAVPGWNVRMHCREQPDVLAEMDEEEDDLRHAWEWAVQHGQLELLENAAEGLYRYYSLSARYEQCASLYRNAEQYLTEQGWLSASLRLWSRLRVCQAELMFCQGEQEQANELIKPVVPALEVDPTTSDNDLAFACVVTAYVLRTTDDSLALKMGERGLALYQALGQPWYISWALFTIACVYDSSGNLKLDRMFAKQALIAIQSLGDPNLIKRIRSSLDFSDLLAGEYQATGKSILEFTGHMLRLSEPHLEVFAQTLLGIYLLHTGCFEESRVKFEHALSKGQEIGYLAYHEVDLGLLLVVDSLSGRYVSALEKADAVIALDPANHTVGSIIVCIKIAQGDLDQAEFILQRALEIFSITRRMDGLGMTLSLAGYLAYRRGDLPAAYSYLRDALEQILAGIFYFDYLVCLGVLARIYADMGKAEQAIELNALCVKHPVAANSLWWDDFIGRQVAELAASLPPARAEAARQRGSQRKLFDVLAQYNERLQKSPDLLHAMHAEPALQVLSGKSD